VASLRARNRGRILATGQEWARGCFVPAGPLAAKRAWLSFPGDSGVIRTEGIPGDSAAPFPTLNWGEQQYKLFGVVTNRDLAGDKLIMVVSGTVWQGRRDACHHEE